MLARNSAIFALFFVGLAATYCDGDDFPAIYNNDSDALAEPMPATEAARAMRTPPGFRVDVFASEPDVQNPIAMAWDARGRLWVAENYTYSDREQQFDLSLRDRVLVLEDADGDGAAERRTVFTDQVQMLTSVEIGLGGVWLMCPPRLLFVPDRDRDDRPDGPAEVVLDGFEVASENYHNFANGLRFGPDGWLYGRCGGSCPGRIGPPGTPDERRVALEGGMWRYDPRSKRVEALCHGTTNPWGHDWNSLGEGFFINTVNGHLWSLIPGSHCMRPFTLDPNPHVYQLIDMHADHWHFDTGTAWQESRDGAANAFGGGHAHCGMMIYLGGQWPDEYRDRLLTWNIHGRRANQEVLQRRGAGYVAKHGDDLLLAADPFFRGMDLSYGADGAVYAIDWSDTGECHEHTGVHRTSGRVYRIVSEANERPREAINLNESTSRALADFMTHRNEWFARQARIVLAERSLGPWSDDLSQAESALRKYVQGANEETAFRALATLQAMRRIDEDVLHEVLRHSNEHLRAWAVRLISDAWPLDDVMGPTMTAPETERRVQAECNRWLPTLCELAASDDGGLVRLALASTLQRLPVDRRIELAAPLVARTEDAEDHDLPLLVWYGLIPTAEVRPESLAKLACSPCWPTTQQLIARRLAEGIDRWPVAVEILLARVVESPGSAESLNLLSGVAAGLKGWRQASAPRNWEEVAADEVLLRDEAAAAIVRDLSVLFGDGRALDAVRSIVLDEDAEIDVRRSALETLVERGDESVAEICLPLLADPRLNLPAARGLAKSNDPAAARGLIENYRKFRAPLRPQVTSILVSRAPFAAELLNAVETGLVPSEDLTAFDVRQIGSLGDIALSRRVAELWGEVRDSPAAKQERIVEFKRRFTPAALGEADLSQGRRLFDQSCAKCHRLFGEGEAIGPDLTGGNRTNLDYLLENVVDPSAVVSKDFRMSVVVLADGRVLNGLVIAQNEKTVTLQTQTDQITIDRTSMEELRITTQSPMPEGLFDNLTFEESRDLAAYLMQPAQVPLPTGEQ